MRHGSSYRWRVIVGIVSGSLVLLSVLWFIGACLCVGTRCCRRPCGCCGGSRRHKRSRNTAGAAAPTGLLSSPREVVRAPGQGGGVTYRPAPPPAPVYHSTTATPTSTIPYDEDALPPMPTWDAAPSKKVLDEDHVSGEDLELENLHLQSSLVSHGPTTGAVGDPRRRQPDPALSPTSSQQHGYQHQYQHQPDYRSGGYDPRPGGEGREGGRGYGHGHYNPDPYSSAGRPRHPPFLASTTPDGDDSYSSPPARYIPAAAPDVYESPWSVGPPSYRS